MATSRNERTGRAQGRRWEKALREGLGTFPTLTRYNCNFESRFAEKGKAAFPLIYAILEAPFEKNKVYYKIDIKLIIRVNIYLE